MPLYGNPVVANMALRPASERQLRACVVALPVAYGERVALEALKDLFQYLTYKHMFQKWVV